MSFFSRHLVELDEAKAVGWIAAINNVTANLYQFEAEHARLRVCPLSCLPGYFYMHMIDRSSVPPDSVNFLVSDSAHVLDRSTLKKLFSEHKLELNEGNVAEYIALYLKAKVLETHEPMELVPTFDDLPLADTPPDDVAEAMAATWPKMTVIALSENNGWRLRAATVFDDCVNVVGYNIRPDGQVTYEIVRPMYDQLPLMRYIPF